MLLVAPHAGAWIETLADYMGIPTGIPSHPTRVRGLKQHLHVQVVGFLESHPTRVRGLKRRQDCTLRRALYRSHPTRVRGLKQLLRPMLSG